MKVEPSETDQVEDETEQVDKSDEATSILEAEKLSALPDLALKNGEIDMLRAELEDKGKQLEVLVKKVRSVELEAASNRKSKGSTGSGDEEDESADRAVEKVSRCCCCCTYQGCGDEW
ncbi:hypothetical protein C1H46_000281 [Malus baccata]|uniref:Uncharacterized protein n=1 Tax=Malus baccata TaxID=106549 RepID=A0A540NTJ5_MALBA|nr:hypothetical protein C1H46_000281 [Malus baccata]